MIAIIVAAAMDTAFTSCIVDKAQCCARRPLFVQFCGNDADTVLAAARHIEDQVDAVDLNFGCPQRIARRGKYGAFLMDDLELVCCTMRRSTHQSSC